MWNCISSSLGLLRHERPGALSYALHRRPLAPHVTPPTGCLLRSDASVKHGRSKFVTYHVPGRRSCYCYIARHYNHHTPFSVILFAGEGRLPDYTCPCCYKSPHTPLPRHAGRELNITGASSSGRTKKRRSRHLLFLFSFFGFLVFWPPLYYYYILPSQASATPAAPELARTDQTRIIADVHERGAHPIHHAISRRKRQTYVHHQPT